MSPAERRINTHKMILAWCDFHRAYRDTLAAGECQPIAFIQEVSAAGLEGLEKDAAEILAQIDPSA